MKFETIWDEDNRPSESLYITPSIAAPQQPICLALTLERPVPRQCTASVTYSHVVDGALIAVGTSQLADGCHGTEYPILAPDCRSGMAIYVCLVAYYDARGNRIGGDFWSNPAGVTVVGGRGDPPSLYDPDAVSRA